MANTTGKKFGGRKKGTPNRLTKELRITLKNFLYGELQNIHTQMEELSPKERLDFLIKLLPYILPKVEAINHTDDEPMDWGF